MVAPSDNTRGDTEEHLRHRNTLNRRRLQFAYQAMGASLSTLWYVRRNNLTPESSPLSLLRSAPRTSRILG